MSNDPIRLFVGVGSDGIRPVGYKTIDIDPKNNPDIVADAAKLDNIETGSAAEFYASHVLEHFSWPRALLVLKEWARVLSPGGVLKIAVPDMEIYAYMLMKGHNPHQVMADVYGGHWAGEGGPQGHHYGYTRRMLAEVLTVLGFSDFSFWRSDFREAANTWVYGENQERIGVSINIAAVKTRDPLLDIDELAHYIRHHDIRESFMVLVRKRLVDKSALSGLQEIDSVLFQKLNFQYLEATHLANYWRERAETAEKAAVPG